MNGKYQLYEGQDYFYHFSIYAPAGIPDAGRYYYTMPEGVSIVGEPSSPITANDGTQIGTLTASGDGSTLYLDMVDNTKIRLRLRFDMAVEFERGEDGQPINSEFEFIQDDQDEDPQIAKTGRFNSDGQLEWTITALVPGWNGNESDYVTWSFSDVTYSEQTGNEYYPDLSSAEINIAISGVTKTLHTVEEADTLNEVIAYFWEPDGKNSRLYLVVKHVLKVWEDDGNKDKRPDEIVVQLLRDGRVYDNVTLNEGNNWRHIWTGLDADSRWRVVEYETPKGYTVAVDRQGITFVMTNSWTEEIPDEPPPEGNIPPPPDENIPDEPPPGSDWPGGDEPDEPGEPDLPQTGVLWWPVPVLACAGLFLFLIGWGKRRHERP